MFDNLYLLFLIFDKLIFVIELDKSEGQNWNIFIIDIFYNKIIFISNKK